jgi:hypothetical protein
MFKTQAFCQSCRVELSFREIQCPCCQRFAISWLQVLVFLGLLAGIVYIANV